MQHNGNVVDNTAFREAEEDKAGFCELRCRRCRRLAYLCLPCNHGQAYCSPECRLMGKARIHADANARLQTSDEGRLDHRDRNRAYRARRNVRVTDVGVQKLADLPICVLANDSAASIVDSPAVVVGRNEYESRCKVQGASGAGTLLRCMVCGREGSFIRMRMRRGAGNWGAKRLKPVRVGSGAFQARKTSR